MRGQRNGSDEQPTQREYDEQLIAFLHAAD
jgi:hypothetical protein